MAEISGQTQQIRMKFAITKKIGMTRVFDENGKHQAVTLLSAVAGTVVRHKSEKTKDGYNAIVVEIKPEKKNSKSQFYEFKVDDIETYKIDSVIDLSEFNTDDEVVAEGIAKGKGFAGTIKRHGFHRGPVTHGSHNIRQPGSIGGGYPERVVAGKKMPGRLGGRHVTAKNLKVVSVMTEQNMIAISGSIPGSTKGIVKIYTN